jgi:hypothetical protein
MRTAAALLAWRHRFIGPVEVWTLIGAYTVDRLLAPP